MVNQSQGYTPPTPVSNNPSPTQSPVAAAFEAGLVPSWKGLKTGGEKTPVTEFIGKMTRWKTEPDNFQNINIIFSYDQCQVLDSTAPYPSAEVVLSIKYSETENSGWGKAGGAYARANGIDIEQLELNMLIGQIHHMVLKSEHYGTNKAGEAMVGNAWNCIKINPASDYNPSLSKAQYLAGALTAPQPVVVQTQPQSQVSQQTMVESPAPVAESTSTPQDARGVALSILHGKSLADFFTEALAHADVKSDNALVQAIVSRTFLASEVAAGIVAENPDGTYSVLSMV